MTPMDRLGIAAGIVFVITVAALGITHAPQDTAPIRFVGPAITAHLLPDPAPVVDVPRAVVAPGVTRPATWRT